MVLGHLLYISDAVGEMGPEQLEAIRTVSRHNNAAEGITGVLFYSAGHFVQLLEGDTAAIHALFEKIATDPRHENVKLLYLRDARERAFCDWSMALLDLDGYSEQDRLDLEDMVHLAGYHVNHPDEEPLDLAVLNKFRALLTA